MCELMLKRTQTEYNSQALFPVSNEIAGKVSTFTLFSQETCNELEVLCGKSLKSNGLGIKMNKLSALEASISVVLQIHRITMWKTFRILCCYAACRFFFV